MATSLIKLLLAVTSPVVFLKLNNSDLITHAISVAESFCVENGSHTHLAIAAPTDLMEGVRNRCKQMKIHPELIEVDPLDPAALVTALACAKEFEILGIHDA